MPRPDKIGLDYFPFDVDFFEDEKIGAISGEFGLKGEMTVIRLLCAVYRNGYFALWEDKLKMKLLKGLPGVSEDLLEQIVNRLVRWEIFDKNLFDSVRVLTSKGIQHRFFSATRRRRNMAIVREYLLVNPEEFGVIVDNNGVIADMMSTETQKLPTQGQGGVIADNNRVIADMMSTETGLMSTKTPYKSKVKNNIYNPLPPKGGLSPFDKGDPPQSSSRTSVPYQEIVDMWNTVCTGYHRLTGLSEKRKIKLKNRYEELSRTGEPLPLFRTLFEKMENTPFLQGDNRRGWKATFDWLISNGENWRKVMEGNYDNIATPRMPMHNQPQEDVYALNERLRRESQERIAMKYGTKAQEDMP